MQVWQLFLAHLVGPGPFLTGVQLSLVVWGGRDNERFSKYATFLGKGAFWLIWDHVLVILTDLGVGFKVF